MLTEYNLILDKIDKVAKLAKEKQILFSNGALSGEVTCCYVFGIDYTTGNFYYKDSNGEWVLSVGGGGGGGLFDAIVAFSVNADPNTVGTTFSPNNPALDTVLYVSTIDFSQWVYYSGAYHSYVSPFWTLRGNASTTPGTDFIGTTDNKGLMFKTNNIQSGYINLVRSSTSFGYESLLNNANSYNTGFGYQALKLNSSGVSNSSLGYLALGNNTTGSNNTGVGHGALYSSATSSNNTAVGYGALLVSTGEQNTAVGSAALYSITSGVRNTALGFRALGLGTASNDNIAIGYQSLYSIGAGTYNISIGQNAMGSAVVSGNFNVGIGNNSLYSLTSGTSNIAIGAYSGYYNITGSDQVFINSLNRGSYANEQTQSPVYIQQHATVSSQNIYLNGEIYHPYLTNLATQDRLVGVLNSSGRLGNITLGSGLSLSSGVLDTSGTVSTSISSLLAATAANGIDNANYQQSWQWNTLGNNIGLYLNANTTAAAGNNQNLFVVSLGGANANSTQTTYAANISNTHTGTSSTNIALKLSANNGTTNQALWVARGSVVLGTSSVESGVILFNGSTSGTVTLQPASAAGTWTLTLPTTDGNSGEFLQTDGSGVCTWASPIGLTVGTSTITSGTNTKILFNNAGILGEYTISGTGNVAMTASPAFTGTPTAPTAATTTNTTQVATTAFVQQELTATTVYFAPKFSGAGTIGDPIDIALVEYANNAAALLGGLSVGDFYYTNVSGDGIVKVVI